MRAEFGAAGSQAITPAIDGLMGQGLYLAKAYAQASLCGPSRSSFLIGRRPKDAGVLSNYGMPNPPYTTLASTDAIPRVFRDQGYLTLSISKGFHMKGGCEMESELWNGDSSHPCVSEYDVDSCGQGADEGGGICALGTSCLMKTPQTDSNSEVDNISCKSKLGDTCAAHACGRRSAAGARGRARPRAKARPAHVSDWPPRHDC